MPCGVAESLPLLRVEHGPPHQMRLVNALFEYRVPYLNAEDSGSGRATG